MAFMKIKAIYVIYFATFLIALSVGIFLALPLFVETLGGNEVTTAGILWSSGIGTISFILISKVLLRTIPANYLACLGSILYGMGSLGFLFTPQIDSLIYIFGLFLGAGWGTVFNTTPFMLTCLLDDTQQQKGFAYLSTCMVLGTGTPLVIAHYFYPGMPDFKMLFTIATFLCAISSISFYVAKVELHSTEPALNFLENAKRIFESPAKYPLALVFIIACAFTVMINFQTTYAQSIGLHYAYFFMTYSSSVIVSRLLLTRFSHMIEINKLIIILMGALAISLSSFLFINQHIYLYILSAMLFGLSYGAAYPTLQAFAVQQTQPILRSDVLSYFSLFYFIAVYGFPMLAAIVIVHAGYSYVIFLLVLFMLIGLYMGVRLNNLRFLRKTRKNLR